MKALKPCLINPAAGLKVQKTLNGYNSLLDQIKNSFRSNRYAELSTDVLIWGNDIVLNILAAHELALFKIRTLIYFNYGEVDLSTRSEERYLCFPEKLIAEISRRADKEILSIFDLIEDLNEQKDSSGSPYCYLLNNCQLHPSPGLSKNTFVSEHRKPEFQESIWNEFVKEIESIDISKFEDNDINTLLTSNNIIKTGDKDLVFNKLSYKKLFRCGQEELSHSAKLSLEEHRINDYVSIRKAVEKIALAQMKIQ